MKTTSNEIKQAFLNTITRGDLDKFKEMLKEYPDLKDYRHPSSKLPVLYIIFCNRQSNFFSHLLNCGADVNATINNNPIIFVLISSYDDEDEFYKFDYLKSFLKKKPNLELLHSNGNTPLITAVEGYEDDLVKLLIESGANPNTKNKQGDTSLHIAISKTILIWSSF
jgi:ankyrin repeat protein